MGAGESRCGGRRFESRARERRSFLNKINIGPLSQLEIQHLVCLFKIKQQSKQTLKLMSHKWSWSLSSALKLIMIKASFLAARHKLSSRKELHFNRMHVNSFMPENDLTIPSKNKMCYSMKLLRSCNTKPQLTLPICCRGRFTFCWQLLPI